MNARAQTILRLDGAAASVAGLSMLAAREWLSALHAFAPALLLFMALSNLAYASYSGTLAVRAYLSKVPTRPAIDVLVIANFVWVAVCCAIIAVTWRSATTYGLAHVALEGAFVGGLALAEFWLVRPFAR